jgi:enamine deaminase RidA (YjgF/YER057c/UK114 family)
MSQTCWQDMLPAPPFRLAGELVYVSSIHPLTEQGRLAEPVRPSRWTGDSDAAAQMRSVLATLRNVLEQAGSDMTRVVRLELQLVSAALFPEVKLALEETFGSYPALTTIIVGDEHLIDGALLSLHGVALHGASTHPLKHLQPSGLASPNSAEAASLAVQAGPFVFTSGLTATDYESGLAVAPTTNTYHDSAAILQAQYVIDVLERTLGAAGARLEDLVKVQFYEPDLSTFPIIDATWGARVGVPPTRSSMACRGLLTPGACWSVNAQAVVPGYGLEKSETRAGIPWHPVDAGKANFSPGITAGEWLFTAGQVPVSDISTGSWVQTPGGMPHHWSNIELQTEFTLELLAEQLRANGFTFDDVVDAKVYLVNPRRDFRGFARIWTRCFPDDRARPALSIIPSTQFDGRDGVMIDGPLLEVDLTSRRFATADARG